jgi:hypothetical protein
MRKSPSVAVLASIHTGLGPPMPPALTLTSRYSRMIATAGQTDLKNS